MCPIPQFKLFAISWEFWVYEFSGKKHGNMVEFCRHWNWRVRVQEPCCSEMCPSPSRWNPQHGGTSAPTPQEKRRRGVCLVHARKTFQCSTSNLIHSCTFRVCIWLNYYVIQKHENTWTEGIWGWFLSLTNRIHRDVRMHITSYNYSMIHVIVILHWSKFIELCSQDF